MSPIIYNSMNEFVIVFWSVSEWDKMGRRPMIRALAKNLKGIANILYVDTPFSPVTTFLSNRERYNRINKKSSLDKISRNLYIFRPKGLLNTFIINKLGIQNIYWKKMGERIKKVLLELEWSDCKKLSWINYPYQISQLGVLDESLMIYECYDEYRSFSQDKKKNQWMSDLEDKLLKKVDIVFTTSGPLYESRKKLHSNVFLTPNGVEFNLFNKVKSNVEVLNDMAHIPYPIIGYIGRVRNWLDFELLKYISEKQPNWSIVFIGPCSTDEREVREFISNTKSNIFFIGEKKHKYIPRYLNIIDVCILPFKTNDLCNAVNPLKLWEYLAVGKPVVSSKLNSLEIFSNVIFLEDTKEDFVNRIDNILNNINNGYIRKRLDSGVELAKKHSWKTITKEIADILTAESHKIQ